MFSSSVKKKKKKKDWYTTIACKHTDNQATPDNVKFETFLIFPDPNS